jgi:hypothetical protein
MTSRRTTRLGSAFVLALLASGCLALWIAVPLAGMWLAGQMTDSFAWHMPLAMALIVPGMIAFAAVLAWLNDLYLRITGGDLETLGGGFRARRRGPLEPLLVGALVLAACAFAAWFLVFAENPDLRVW